jgi:hypothetical protein
MRNRTVFTEVETLRHQDKARSVSPLALEIHVRAVARTVRTANPCFISDASLDNIAPGHVTTMAAIELCLAGMWYRTTHGFGGYVIADTDFVDHMTTPSLVRHFAAACRRLWRELNSEKVIPF